MKGLGWKYHLGFMLTKAIGNSGTLYRMNALERASSKYAVSLVNKCELAQQFDDGWKDYLKEVQKKTDDLQNKIDLNIPISKEEIEEHRKIMADLPQLKEEIFTEKARVLAEWEKVIEPLKEKKERLEFACELASDLKTALKE